MLKIQPSFCRWCDRGARTRVPARVGAGALAPILSALKLVREVGLTRLVDPILSRPVVHWHVRLVTFPVLQSGLKWVKTPQMCAARATCSRAGALCVRTTIDGSRYRDYGSSELFSAGRRCSGGGGEHRGAGGHASPAQADGCRGGWYQPSTAKQHRPRHLGHVAQTGAATNSVLRGADGNVAGWVGLGRGAGRRVLVQPVPCPASGDC